MVAIGRIAKGVGKLLFDPKFTDTVTDTLRASKKANGWKNIHKQVGDAFISAEKATANTSIWKNMVESGKTLPKDIKTAVKGASGFWGKTKGFFGQLGKRMPLIGALMMVGFELPNIVSAFKDKGFLGGICEVGKSTARLTGFMGGMAIGQALIPIPILGGIIGGIAGDWLVSKVVGKSHSEKKAEQEEAQQEQLAQQQAMMQQGMVDPNAQTSQNPYATNPYVNQTTTQPIQTPKMTMTPQQIAAMGQMLAGGYGLNSYMDQDFMAMNSGLSSGMNMNYLC